MKGLQSLIRLQNWKVDEKRRELGVLEGKRSEYIKQGEDLEIEMQEEQALAERDDMNEQYGLYAAQVIERRENLANNIAELDKEIVVIHDQLSLLYQELKKFEISLERRQKEAETLEKTKAQIELDEMSMNMHQRSERSA